MPQISLFFPAQRTPSDYHTLTALHMINKKIKHYIQKKMVQGRCEFLSLVLRLVEGDSGGSEGVTLEPRPLLAGEAGGVEAEDRPLALLTPVPLLVKV